MDRITRSLLDEFAKEHGLMSLREDTQFEHFASYLVVSRHYGETFDTGEIVVGEGGDTGIDAIAVLVNGSLVSDPDQVEELADTNGYLDVTFVFVQAERSPSFDTAKMAQFAYGVTDFFRDKPTLTRNAAVTEAAAVMSAIIQRSGKFKRGNPICRLYYVTTGQRTDDPNLQSRRRTEVEDLDASGLFREVDLILTGADSIQKLYQQTKNAISREFSFPDRTVIPEIPGVTEAYLGLLPATEFLSLLQDDQGELIKTIFYDNVRDWQNYNPVNSEIRETLVSPTERSQFALMNNGVTIIAKTLRATGNRFFVEDYQIVNGCQTSHVLFDQKAELDDTVMIPLRLIATQDEEVIASIVRATNRQTEVKKEQLLALSDFQKKLELYFLSFDELKLYYERRSRQFNNMVGIEKTRIVTPANLIRAFASMFLEEPHRTTRTYRALLEQVGKDIFGEQHKLDPYYVAALALYRLEYLFRNQTVDSKLKPARYHILLAARLLAAPDRPPRANSRDMERYCEPIRQHLWETSSALTLLTNAANVVDRTAQGNFHRDHIRTLTFTDALKKNCTPSPPVMP